MALGTPVSRLLSMLRAEARRTQTVSVGLNADDTLRQKLARVQDDLWMDYDWPHLRVYRDFQTQAGQRYYDFPVDLDYSRIEKFDQSWANLWRPVMPGITDSDYNLVNPDLGARQDPQLKWELRENMQIELWPPPASNGTCTRIWGIKTIAPLVADTSLAELDDNLIVLHVAAELLAGDGAKDASMMQGRATRRLLTLRGNTSNKKRYNMIGHNRPHGTRDDEDAYRMRVTYAKAQG
jgi:hypothetical protein